MSGAPGRLGLVLLVGLALGWGVNWPLMKLALDEIPPWTFRGVTGMAALLACLAFAYLTRRPLAMPRREWPAIFGAAMLNYTIWQICVTFGLTMMGSGQAALLTYTMPLWAAILGAIVFKERLGARRVLGLALGLSGVFALLSEDPAALGVAPEGALLITLGAITWAAGTILLKRVRWTASVFALTSWQVILGAPPIFAVALITEGLPIAGASPLALFGVGYTVVIGFMFGFYAWTKIVSLYPATVAAIGSLAVPIVGVASGALMLGERFGWREAAAVVLITAGLLLVLLFPGRGRARGHPAAAVAALTERSAASGHEAHRPAPPAARG